MDALHSDRERIKKVYSLSGVQASPGLALEKGGEKLAFHILGDEDSYRLPLELYYLFRVVMNDDRTSAQLVELTCVETRRLVARIPVGEEQLCRSLDMRVLLSNLCDLPRRCDGVAREPTLS